ncbi:MAG: hypothetical protein IIZ83_06175 [Oscillospiraceae bacterium]|nr:hypothetical protein [Oscillospiraceae bacterium]
MPDLGKAFVQIVPSAEGISGSITDVLRGEADSAGAESGSIFSEKLVSTIKSVVAAAGIGAAISTAIGKVGDLAAMGDTIDKQSQKIGISAKAYQEWDAVLQHSGSSISAMQGAMKKLTFEAASGSDAFQKLGISQEEALGMSQEDLFSRVITGLQGMEQGTERTALAQELLGRSAQEMAALLNTSAEDTQAMKDRVNELGGVMSDDAVKSAAAYQDALQDMQTAMAGFGRGLVGDFLGPFTEVMDGITTIFSGDAEGGVGKIVTGLSDIGTAIANGVPELAGHAAELVTGVVGAIEEGMPEFVAQGTEMVANAATGFIEGLPEMITSAGELVTQVVNYLLDNGPQMLEQGVNMVTQIAGGIIQNLPAIVTAIASVIAQILASIGEHLPEILQKGIELLGQLLAGIVEAIPKIPGEIAKVINGIKGEFEKFNWKDIGDKIIEGIKTGLTSAAGKLKEAALDAAKKAFQAVKDFFGIKSPSKLMHDEIGAYIPAGIALGIEDNLGLVTDAMDDLSAAATGTISANVKAAGPSAAAVGGVTVNVYGAPGQDERVIAEQVANIINTQIHSRRAAFA